MKGGFKHGNASGEEWEIIKAWLEKLESFQRRETEMCPYCGQHVTALRQVGRSVYGSCGCRLWQGWIPTAWR